MKKEFLMGNEAIALGAIYAGVNMATGYPGTPSTEILEYLAKQQENIYVEWSVNEKVALEVATGASYSGARTLITMKQVGLNVAADPLMSLSYIGVEGGMVIVVADDPGPISSQTEQDTRRFAKFAKIPVFDPSTPEEAFYMIQDAFLYSEKYKTPVLFRPTTRVCHSYSTISIDENTKQRHKNIAGFIKDTKKWVVFPHTSFLNHQKIAKREFALENDFSNYSYNHTKGIGPKGILCSGVSYTYVQEFLQEHNLSETPICKIATPYPFPTEMVLNFLNDKTEILVVEELDSVLEEEVLQLIGKYHLNVKVKGKQTGHLPIAGENTIEIVAKSLQKYLDITDNSSPSIKLPDLPQRPPMLCAGCPHRASFYAVKKASKNISAVYSGDIGCYTLGNAQPLNMVDTCLCMGAGITIAQGLELTDRESTHFAFIGDSTFFASGITGIINAVYNQTDMILIVLDNSTTAMTGHQPHPGTGKTLMKTNTAPIPIDNILEAIGLSFVTTINPFDFENAVETVKKVIPMSGVRAIIFKAPCIASIPKLHHYTTNEKCISCKECIYELGCPAFIQDHENVSINPSLCYGCGLCASICPINAIDKIIE